MLFNSYPFILAFLPIALFGFFALAHRSHALAAGWLTFVSLAFYAWWNPAYVGLLLGSIAFNYVFGMQIAQANARGARARAKSFVVFAIAADLALLGYVKYANFFLESLANLTGIESGLGSVILPLGISFFTFTQIAFLVDTYRGQVREYNFVHFALFVTYFPHLIAGPILHHKEMMPQFGSAAIYRAHAENFAVGLTIFALGLFKKTVLADGVAPYVGSPFAAAAAGQPLSFFDAWGGALAYTCQLYFDFSGYSDMAIGLSRLFGVQLPLNFNSPYKATNIIEFWRRWHMTLSRFLREYLYIALGGNRRGASRRYSNLFITMMLGGFWHGAGWTFVIWGSLHGVYLAINHAWRALREHMGWRETGPAYCIAARALTLVAVVVGWVFFRASSVDAAVGLLKGMAGFNGVTLPSAVLVSMPALGPIFERVGIGASLGGGAQFLKTYLWVIGLLALALFAPNTQQIMARFRPGLDASRESVGAGFWQPSRSWAIVMAVIGALGFLSLNRASEFLYFQF